MAIDHNIHVWVASNGPCGLVDVDGFVWLVDQEGRAWKIDTANVPAMQNIPVQGSHDVYSDMTGG